MWTPAFSHALCFDSLSSLDLSLISDKFSLASALALILHSVLVRIQNCKRKLLWWVYDKHFLKCNKWCLVPRGISKTAGLEAAQAGSTPASYCEGCWRGEGFTAAGHRDRSPSDSRDSAQVSPIELIPLSSLLWNGRLQGLLLPKVVHFWSEIFMTVSNGWNLTICKDGRCTVELMKLQLRTPYMHRPLPRPWESPGNGIDSAQFA